MATRREQERIDVARYMPGNTRHVVADGKDVWIFQKFVPIEDFMEHAKAVQMNAEILEMGDRTATVLLTNQ